MNTLFRIALLGDYNPTYEPHYRATDVLQQWQHSLPFSFAWIPTGQLDGDINAVLADFSGIWAGSGRT